MKPLATIRSYDDLHELLRTRAVELNLTREMIDHISGMPNGRAGRLLAPNPPKRFGWDAWPLIMPTFALKIVAVEDEEALARINRREPVRDSKKAMHAKTVHITFSRRKMLEGAKKGGKNSRAYMGKRKRKMLARKAARARWRKPEPKRDEVISTLPHTASI